MIYMIDFIQPSKAETTVFTLSLFKWVYFYPTPTKIIGFPVADVNDNAAPTNFILIIERIFRYLFHQQCQISIK